MIMTGAENVASREVEEAIYELGGVAEVAVFGIRHPRWIQAVTAVVVPKAGADLALARVREHVRTRLAGYKRPQVRAARRQPAEEPEREAPQARAAGRARRSRGAGRGNLTYRR